MCLFFGNLSLGGFMASGWRLPPLARMSDENSGDDLVGDATSRVDLGDGDGVTRDERLRGGFGDEAKKVTCRGLDSDE
jgi:hypothetical protein